LRSGKINENSNYILFNVRKYKKAYPNRGAKKFLWGGKSAVMREKPKLLPYEFKAEQYDTVIMGTPVWASSFAPPIRTFVQENKSIQKKNLLHLYALAGAVQTRRWIK